MTESPETPGRGRGFYGWIALTGAVLVYFTGSGTFFFSYGVFLPNMCDELGWSRGAVAAGLSLGLLSFGLPSPLIGASVAKFGPRINMVLGSSLAALGLAGMSMIQEVWHLYFLYGCLIGLGSGFGMFMACTTVVNNWFVRKRSLVMGLVIAAGGLGGFAFPLLVTELIGTIGWRMSWLSLAGIHFTFAVLIGGLLLVRNRPEDVGQMPDGITMEPSKNEEGVNHNSEVYKSQVDWKIKQALQKRTTWLIAIIGAANLFAIGTINTHQVAYLGDLGFTPIVAAMALSLIPGMSTIGRLGVGVLALRFDVRHLAIVSFGVQLIALGILLTTTNLVLIYTYAILYGISYGALVVALPVFVGVYYGRANYAKIMGLVFPLGIAAEAVGPVLAGAIYDTTATYTPAFIMVAAISLVGLVCAIMARHPRLLL